MHDKKILLNLIKNLSVIREISTDLPVQFMQDSVLCSSFNSIEISPFMLQSNKYKLRG